MVKSLIEVIDRLDETDDSDRYRPRIICAEYGTASGPQDRAAICQVDEDGSFPCRDAPSLREVLMVHLAREAIEVWSEWRGGKIPNPREKYEAVIFYARHDAYQPVDENS